MSVGTEPIAVVTEKILPNKRGGWTVCYNFKITYIITKSGQKLDFDDKEQSHK